ncbi:MAG: EthD family reductase [Gluconacetobacter diazotrophicus]|nr:EthD family reductase [Gluconacetobacter diazotrophicus]
MIDDTRPVTIYATYQGDHDARFDRDYYVTRHLPLVLEAWRPYGLDSAEAFFPATTESGTIAITELRFRSQAAFDAAFAAPETGALIDDISAFTDLQAVRVRAIPT